MYDLNLQNQYCALKEYVCQRDREQNNYKQSSRATLNQEEQHVKVTVLIGTLIPDTSQCKGFNLAAVLSCLTVTYVTFIILLSCSCCYYCRCFTLHAINCFFAAVLLLLSLVADFLLFALVT